MFHIIKKNRILCLFLYSIILIAMPILSLAATTTHALLPQNPSYLGNLQEIIQRGKLIVAIPQVNIPYLFAPGKDGNLQGYYIDLAKNIAQALGVKMEFNREAVSFNDVVDLIAQGKADVAICHLSKTIERAKKVLYTNNDVTLYQTIVVNRVWLAQHGLNTPQGNDPIYVIKNNKCVIGIIEKSSYIEFAEDLFPLATLRGYPIEKIFPALINGEVNAIFYDDFSVREYLSEHPNIVLKFRAIILTNYPDLIAMAVPPGRWEWLQWLNHYLQLKNIKATADTLLQYRKITEQNLTPQPLYHKKSS